MTRRDDRRRFTGDLDIASEVAATAALERRDSTAARVLVADLRELDFLDSTGVRVLLTADLTAREQGVRFGVARGDGMVRAPARGHPHRPALPAWSTTRRS